MLLLQLTPFFADSTHSLMVVGLVIGLDPSRQVQAHVTHSCLQCVAPGTKEIIQQRGKSVTNIRSSHILHRVQNRLLVKLKLILNHKQRSSIPESGCGLVQAQRTAVFSHCRIYMLASPSWPRHVVYMCMSVSPIAQECPQAQTSR